MWSLLGIQSRIQQRTASFFASRRANSRSRSRWTLTRGRSGSLLEMAPVTPPSTHCATHSSSCAASAHRSPQHSLLLSKSTRAKTEITARPVISDLITNRKSNLVLTSLSFYSLLSCIFF